MSKALKLTGAAFAIAAALVGVGCQQQSDSSTPDPAAPKELSQDETFAMKDSIATNAVRAYLAAHRIAYRDVPRDLTIPWVGPNAGGEYYSVWGYAVATGEACDLGAKFNIATFKEPEKYVKRHDTLLCIGADPQTTGQSSIPSGLVPSR